MNIEPCAAMQQSKGSNEGRQAEDGLCTHADRWRRDAVVEQAEALAAFWHVISGSSTERAYIRLSECEADRYTGALETARGAFQANSIARQVVMRQVMVIRCRLRGRAS